MSVPLIGITTYGPDTPRPRAGAPFRPASFSLPVQYVDAVSRAGGDAVLIPARDPLSRSLLERLDGLVLSGGGDIDPALFTEERHDEVYMTNALRDAFELELVTRALERPELPVLAICRGMQVLNVALGGDLELHLPDRRGEQVIHRSPPRDPAYHDVRLAEGTLLAEVYGELEFPVCSWHHQEVRKLGRGLASAARAPDGVVEALLHADRPDLLAVQWHPEMQVADDPRQRRIFDWLVSRSRTSS